VAPVTQTVTTSAWASCCSLRTLGAHRNPMHKRLLLPIAGLWLLMLLPAGALAGEHVGARASNDVAARASDYVPNQVIVRYADGTGGGVAAEVAQDAGTEPVAGLPGGSEQLQ